MNTQNIKPKRSNLYKLIKFSLWSVILFIIFCCLAFLIKNTQENKKNKAFSIVLADSLAAASKDIEALQAKCGEPCQNVEITYSKVITASKL